MYEGQTQEVIQSRVLARVPDTLDKREGSLIQTATAPSTVEMAQMYIELDGILNESFADTQSREYLIRRASERGIAPMTATAAVVHGVFNLNDVPIGSRFACGDFIYETTEKISDKNFKLVCMTKGTDPNGTVGEMLPLVTISGLTSATITEILTPGRNDEDTEVFRQRYFDSFQSQSFGGNRADYKEKVLGIDGVGAVKIYRASSVAGDEGTSGGNVRLVILDSDYNVPSSTLVSTVKETMDPDGYDGEGYGLAPIWHHVYVEAATGTTVDVDVTITFASGYSFLTLEDEINEAVDVYFESLAKEWQDDTTGLVIRTSYVQSALLQIEGIVDVTVDALNDEHGNLTLGVDAIPLRGVITCS